MNNHKSAGPVHAGWAGVTLPVSILGWIAFFSLSSTSCLLTGPLGPQVKPPDITSPFQVPLPAMGPALHSIHTGHLCFPVPSYQADFAFQPTGPDRTCFW
ncbi:MAG: hypothetical protein J5I41_02575 [Saprospiraceae bacterium]|nr:hypothetical protein [Saprospiraceae bacterium]